MLKINLAALALSTIVGFASAVSQTSTSILQVQASNFYNEAIENWEDETLGHGNIKSWL